MDISVVFSEINAMKALRFKDRWRVISGFRRRRRLWKANSPAMTTKHINRNSDFLRKRHCVFYL